MKKFIISFLIFLFLPSISFAVERGTAEYEHLKEIKRARRLQNEQTQVSSQKLSQEYSHKELVTPAPLAQPKKAQFSEPITEKQVNKTEPIRNNPIEPYLFSAALVLMAVLLVRVLVRYFSLRRRYKGISDIDAEVSKKKKEAEDLEHSAASLRDAVAKSQVEFDNLKRELTLLEEREDYVEYGIYQPHYIFKSSDEYKRKLEDVYEKQKQFIRENRAIKCSTEWTVHGSRREGERMTKHYSKLMLRAFNGESDAAILKIRWDNVVMMRERVRKAFEAINKLGDTHSISIAQDYFDLAIQELELTYEYQLKDHDEREEQRKIKQRMRDEELAQREIEKARKDAEGKESVYQKALEEAKSEIGKAQGKEVESLNGRIIDLESKLAEATKLKERAMSRAQLTKSGHVYIISNIGSFGENIYKVGMTRRLDPYERVDELGDASVPFDFDIHAMIYSDNAPELESIMHAHLEQKRVNLVNPRKEFFNVFIDEIEQICKQKNLELKLTKLAEAQEYRRTLTLKNKTSK